MSLFYLLSIYYIPVPIFSPGWEEQGGKESCLAIQCIDIEYNKRLDWQRPCLEDKLNGGSDNIWYKVTNQFDIGDKLYL